MKAAQKTQKNIISKKFKSELGLDPCTHPFPCFSRIFAFFLTWQNPLAGQELYNGLLDCI